MSLFKGEDSVTQIDIACVDARLFVSNQVILVNFNILWTCHLVSVNIGMKIEISSKCKNFQKLKNYNL